MRFLRDRAACRRAAALAMALVIAAAGTAGAAAPAVAIVCPSTLQPGEIFSSEIAIEAGAAAIGAYSVVLTYDASDVTVVSVAGGTAAEFASQPFTNPGDFESGRTRIAAFNGASLSSPSGRVDVAKVSFRVAPEAQGPSALGLEVVTLANTDGGRMAASTIGCSVEVESATSPTLTASVRSASETPTLGPSATLSATPTSTAGTRTPTGQPTTAVAPTVTPTPPLAPTTTPTAVPSPTACTGDCDRDGRVRANDVVRALVASASPVGSQSCPWVDEDGDDRLSAAELSHAIANIFTPLCAFTVAEATPRETSIATATPSLTSTPQASPPPTVAAANQPPLLTTGGVYHAYPEQEIRVAVAARDPEGGRLTYVAENCPDGAVIDDRSGVFRWRPRAEQIGAALVTVQVTDEGTPPESASGILAFQVSPLDACVLAECSPPTGCTLVPRALDDSCCHEPAGGRVRGVFGRCPDDRMLLLGRNNIGFGPLQSCDPIRVLSFLQGGAAVRFHVGATCLDASKPLRLHARLETKTRLLVDETREISLRAGENGYAEKRSLVFPVSGAVPPQELEGTEAKLSVVLTDAGGVAASTTLRVLLSFDPVGDLPDPGLVTAEPQPPG